LKSLTMIACTLLSLFLLQLNCPSTATEQKATPQEVMEKVKEAAAFLHTAGEGGLSEFMDSNGGWVWKDTYVWVLKCDEMTDAAHPIKPKLVGKNLAGIKDVRGNYFFVQLCEAAKRPKGGWVEYWWPKVDEKLPSRKIAYVLSVPDSPYQVAAGIYDENISLEQLDKMLQ